MAEEKSYRSIVNDKTGTEVHLYRGHSLEISHLVGNPDNFLFAGWDFRSPEGAGFGFVQRVGQYIGFDGPHGDNGLLVAQFTHPVAARELTPSDITRYQKEVEKCGFEIAQKFGDTRYGGLVYFNHMQFPDWMKEQFVSKVLPMLNKKSDEQK